MFFLSVNLLTNLPMGPSRGASYHAMGSNHVRCVSVEPLPKQGCEVLPVRRSPGVCNVSVEPLPKQGCEAASYETPSKTLSVSVEPLPKQGCEVAVRQAEFRQVIASQWNSCRSRGARRPTTVARKIFPRVSVEPLPKQGCEPNCGHYVPK